MDWLRRPEAGPALICMGASNGKSAMRAATYGGFGPCVDYDPGASAGASNGPVLYGMMQAIVTEAVPLTGPVKCRCGGEPRVARVAEAGGWLSARPGSIPDRPGCLTGAVFPE